MRESLVGLPLQRSTFSQLWSVGALVGSSHVLPDGRFGARLDNKGNLLVDKGHILAMKRAFPPEPSAAFLTALETRRRNRCAALLDSVRQVDAPIATTASGLVAESGLLVRRMADVLPYAILTKFVPEILSDWLTTDPILELTKPDRPSPGLQLTHNLEQLAVWCERCGWPPARVRADWPDVDPAVAGAVIDFSAAHAGFGPVAWEARGFDDPAFVLRMLERMEPQNVARPAQGGADSREIVPAAPVGMDPLDVLMSWLEFTEFQIWYIRHAFFNGLIPRLSALAKCEQREPQTMLFMSAEELAGSWPTERELSLRMEAYWSDSVYLSHNDVPAERLSQLFVAPR